MKNDEDQRTNDRWLGKGEGTKDQKTTRAKVKVRLGLGKSERGEEAHGGLQLYCE